MANATTMVHVRVSKKLKNEAMKVARMLNVSLSFIVEQAFRRFVKERRIVIEDPTWQRRRKPQ